MITPLSVDVDTAADEEIIAAYLEDGDSIETARANLAVIRGQLPPDATVD